MALVLLSVKAGWNYCNSVEAKQRGQRVYRKREILSQGAFPEILGQGAWDGARTLGRDSAVRPKPDSSMAVDRARYTAPRWSEAIEKIRWS